MPLLVPEWVARQQHERAVMDRLYARHEALRGLQAEMKALDSYLSLERAPATVDPDSGLKPGYWYIRRVNPVGPDQLIPWETPTGGFREPDSSIIEFLRRRDLWRDDVFGHASQSSTRREQDRQDRLENMREARVQDAATAIKSIDSPGVSRAAKGRSAKARHR